MLGAGLVTDSKVENEKNVIEIARTMSLELETYIFWIVSSL